MVWLRGRFPCHLVYMCAFLEPTEHAGGADQVYPSTVSDVAGTDPEAAILLTHMYFKCIFVSSTIGKHLI